MPWGKSRKTPREVEGSWEAFCWGGRPPQKLDCERLLQRWGVAWLLAMRLSISAILGRCSPFPTHRTSKPRCRAVSVSLFKVTTSGQETTPVLRSCMSRVWTKSMSDRIRTPTQRQGPLQLFPFIQGKGSRHGRAGGLTSGRRWPCLYPSYRYDVRHFFRATVSGSIGRSTGPGLASLPPSRRLCDAIGRGRPSLVRQGLTRVFGKSDFSLPRCWAEPRVDTSPR